MGVMLPSDVKLATPGDENALVSLLRMRHDEDGFGPFEEECVRLTVRRGICRDYACIGVIRERGDIVGSIGLYIGEFWYNRSPHIMDFWNFVHPLHRRSTHAKNLLMFAKWVSDDLEKPLLMAKISTEQTEQMIKLYERQLPKSGALFFYNLPLGKTA